MDARKLISAHEVSPSLRALFDSDQPVAVRCFAVLDGSIGGKIWTDDPTQPTWGAVVETAYDTLFFGGRPDASIVHGLIEELRQDDGVSLALWPDHPYNQLLPPAPDFDGSELQFTDRPLGTDPLPDISVPEGCALLSIDAKWFERCRYRDEFISFFGSAERTLEQGFGFCLVQGEQLLSEAFACAAAEGVIEIGTITGEAYRRRGYAALCCARLIRECEARGYRTYWNCEKDNLASASLARAMGYQTEQAFRFLDWNEQ